MTRQLTDLQAAITDRTPTFVQMEKDYGIQAEEYDKFKKEVIGKNKNNQLWGMCTLFQPRNRIHIG